MPPDCYYLLIDQIDRGFYSSERSVACVECLIRRWEELKMALSGAVRRKDPVESEELLLQLLPLLDAAHSGVGGGPELRGRQRGDDHGRRRGRLQDAVVEPVRLDGLGVRQGAAHPLVAVAVQLARLFAELSELEVELDAPDEEATGPGAAAAGAARKRRRVQVGGDRLRGGVEVEPVFRFRLELRLGSPLRLRLGLRRWLGLRSELLGLGLRLELWLRGLGLLLLRELPAEPEE